MNSQFETDCTLNPDLILHYPNLDNLLKTFKRISLSVVLDTPLFQLGQYIENFKKAFSFCGSELWCYKFTDTYGATQSKK